MGYNISTGFNQEYGAWPNDSFRIMRTSNHHLGCDATFIDNDSRSVAAYLLSTQMNFSQSLKDVVSL